MLVLPYFELSLAAASGSYSLAAMRRLLIVVVSPVEGRRLQSAWFSVVVASGL